MKKSDEVLSILANDILLADLIDCLQTGKLHPGSEDESMHANETVVGELTETEKSLFSALNILTDKVESIANTNNQMVNECRNKGEKINKGEVYRNKTEVRATTKMIEGLSEVLFFLIRKRLGDPAYEADGLRIKKGFKIVTFNADHSDHLQMILQSLASDL
jgi:hypothetical protein